jgi:hypothetical protein
MILMDGWLILLLLFRSVSECIYVFFYDLYCVLVCFRDRVVVGMNDHRRRQTTGIIRQKPTRFFNTVYM